MHEKYTFGEIFSSGGATLYKNPSDQTVIGGGKVDKIGMGNKCINLGYQNCSFGPMYVETEEECKLVMELVKFKVSERDYKDKHGGRQTNGVYASTAAIRAQSMLSPDIVRYLDRAFTNQGMKENIVGRKKRNYPKRSEIIKILDPKMGGDKDHHKDKIQEKSSEIGNEGQTDYKCDSCDKSFSNVKSLKIHSNLEIFSKFLCACNICNKQFLDTSLLIAHSNVCKKSNVCNICKKALKTNYELKEHIRTHTGEKSRSLKKHSQSQNCHKKDHKCDTCGKSFTKLGNLKTHIQTLHEGQRNFKCDSCEKSFTSSGYLKTHIKTIHEGQRNFKCDSCGNFFTQSMNLKRRIKTIHDGQKNYKCNYCEKKFGQSGHLKTHIKMLHDNP